MQVGAYTGSGTASRVVDIGFTPVAVWVYPAGFVMSNRAVAAAITARSSVSFDGGMWAENTEHWQGIVENGFMTGTSETGLGMNRSNVDYFWVAFE